MPTFLLPLLSLLTLLTLPPPTSPAQILTTLQTSSTTVGDISTITLTMDRTKSISGATITPTPINTTIYNILFTFDTAFGITTSNTAVANNNFTVNQTTNTVLVRYDSVVNGGSVIRIVVTGVRNPFVSGVALSVFVKISNSNSVLVDQSSVTMTAVSAQLLESDISYTFTPQNVSTISNLSLSIRSTLFDASQGMYLQISFRRFWTRSLSNNTQTAIFSTSTSCIPSCNTSRPTNANLVSFRNTSLSTVFNTITRTLSLVIVGIQSPPTLQQADSIQIVIKQPLYSKPVQKIDSYPITAQSPNSLQTLQSSTPNSISQIITLTLNIATRNEFGPNDTITIKLSQSSSLASTDPTNIILTSFLISSYQLDIQNLNTIVFSTFTFLTDSGSINYANLNANVVINRVVMATSTKPRVGNVVEIARNGFLFGYDLFGYAVVAGVLAVDVALGNNYANSLTNATWKLILNKGVVGSDRITVQIPQKIATISCQPQCQNCTCSLTLPTPSTPYTVLSIQLPPSFQASTELFILTTQKNPISQTQSITACTKDSENYLKQCGSTVYPDIIEASLSAETLSVVSTSNFVYAIANYTFFYNFTNYDLQDGFLITIIPTTLQLIDTTTPVCRINNQAQCRISTNSTGTYINTTITSPLKIYTITLSNIRNAPSTRPLTISAKVAYISNQFYYSIQSDYINATQPLILSSPSQFNFTRSNCINSEFSNSTVNFINAALPFVLVDVFGVRQFQYRVVDGKTGAVTVLLYDVGVGGGVVYGKKNWYSLEPVTYTYTLWTVDLLYQIWQFTITQQNCKAQSIPIIGYQFTGLPQSAGTLRIAYSHQYSNIILPNSPNYSLTLKFPQQYSSSISVMATNFTASATGPRTIVLRALTNQQPVIIELSNFTNVINLNPTFNYTNNPIQIQIFDNNYLIAEDTTTVKYRLADVTDCLFPCKTCAKGNGLNNGTCLQCYSSLITLQYFTFINTSGDGRCVSSCPLGTYTNTAQSKCSPCPTSCSSCTSPTTCQTCSNNNYLFQSQCITDCPSTYYPSTLTQTCASCQQPCQTCSSLTLCKSCTSGYYYFSGTCVTVCPSGYIPQTVNSSAICYGCSLPCLQCAGVITNCTKCITGFYLKGSQCVVDCGGVLIGVDGYCVACSSTCYRCIDTPSTCIQCISPYYLYQQTCILTCPTSYYQSSQTCQSCPQQCKTCTSVSSCSTCSTSFIYYSSSCLSSCPLSMYIQNNTNSSVTQQCKPCASVSCLVCSTGPAQCNVCVGGWFLLNGVCWQKCPTGFYGDGLVCKQCGIGCLDCLNAQFCLNCSVEYALSDNLCLTQCPSAMIQVNNSCLQCSSYIQYCQTCTSLACLSCISPYSLHNQTSTPTCVQTCPTSYISLPIQNISKCIACTLGCSSCSISITNCTSCSTNYLYYESTCVTVCPGSLIPVSGICRSCVSSCATCINNTNNCLTCIQNMFMLVNSSSRVCLSQCPVGYYGEVSTGICVACAVGCRVCVDVGCLTCDSTYFLVQKPVSAYNGTLYQCYTSCPSYLPHIIGTKLCSKCSQHCLQCSQSSCIQCNTTYYSYFQYCVQNCPSPYVISYVSKSCVIAQNSSTNTTNTTTNTTTVVSQSPAQLIAVPVPFTIITIIIVLLIVISKFQYPWTNGVMSLFGWVSSIVLVCLLLYAIMGVLWVVDKEILDLVNTDASVGFVRIACVLLFVAIGIIYVSNIMHTIFGFATYRKDPQFITYSTTHPICNKILFVLCIILQHTIFSLYFSHFLNLTPFRARLKNPHCLSCLNYIWGLALVANILALAAGLILVAQASSVFLYIGIDLIVVDVFVVVTGMVLFRKGKGMGWAADDYPNREGYEASQDDFATKKVVMLDREGQSNAQIGSIFGDPIQQTNINGKIQQRNILDQQTQQKQQGQFYFEQIEGDNKSPTKPNENTNSEQTDENKKSDEHPQNQDQLQDSLKIQPSINILLTAQQMKPGGSVLGLEDNKSEEMNEIGGQGLKESMGWSDIQKSSRVLKNQSKIKPDQNIFQLDQSSANQSPGLSKHNKQKETLKNSKAQLQSQNSSRSLKISPRSNKYQQDLLLQNNEDEKDRKSQNLVLQRLNKNKDRKNGGRMSQQLTSKSESQTNNKGSHKNLRKKQFSDNRPTSKASHRLLNSQLNQIIEEEPEQMNIHKNNQKQTSKEKQREKINQKERSDNEEIESQVKSIVITVRGQDRFISKTLQQDHGMEVLEKDLGIDIDEVGTQQLQQRKSQVQTAFQQKRSSSKNKSRQSISQQKMGKKIMKQRKQSPEKLKMEERQKQAQIAEYDQEEQVVEEQNELNIHKKQQLVENKQEEDGGMENMNQKPFEGANTIFVESDQQKISHQIGSNLGKRITNQKNYHTISDNKAFPASADTFPTASKLRTLQLRQQLQNSRQNNGNYHSLSKKHKKSFRSRNISADKLRPNTSDQTMEHEDKNEYERGSESRGNPRTLMKQIQRKQKLRHHQESLKKIYLRK